MTFGRYETGNLGTFMSENSLDIRNESLGGYREQRGSGNMLHGVGRAAESVETSAGSTPPALRSVKREALRGNMGGTPTELNDFLAMLDDKTTYSEVKQADEPLASLLGNRNGTEYHTGSGLNSNGWDAGSAGTPVGSYPNSFKFSNHSSRNNTLNYSPVATMSAGPEDLSSSPRMEPSRSAKDLAVNDATRHSNSLQEFLDQIDLSYSEEQYINPYLLNKEPDAEVNHQDTTETIFMDEGTVRETSDQDLRHVDETQLFLNDALTILPEIEVDHRRRMSEVVGANLVLPTHSRGSISHQVDFWNLDADKPNRNGAQRHRHSHGNHNSAPEVFDLMSFKKKSPSVSGEGPQVPVTPRQMSHHYLESSEPRSVQTQRTSIFKIDNELTQLLNEYNMNPSNTLATGKNGNKMRAGSLSQPNAKRSNSSNQDQLNRVGKHRYSASLIDGPQNVISKLYGDMTRGELSWENAIVSDEDDEDANERDFNADSKRSSVLFRTTEDSSGNISAPRTNGKFISPKLLNNDPSTDTQTSSNKSLTGVDKTGLNFELNLPITNPEALIHSSKQSISPPNPFATPINTDTSIQPSNSRRKRSSTSKTKAAKSNSPLDGEEKPFKCDICGKTFRRSEHLKRHIRSVHSTERPFHCPFCDKKFSRSDNLSQHLKTHKKHGDITEIPPPRRVTHSSNKQ